MYCNGINMDETLKLAKQEHARKLAEKLAEKKAKEENYINGGKINLDNYLQKYLKSVNLGDLKAKILGNTRKGINHISLLRIPIEYKRFFITIWDFRGIGEDYYNHHLHTRDIIARSLVTTDFLGELSLKLGISSLSIKLIEVPFDYGCIFNGRLTNVEDHFNVELHW